MNRITSARVALVEALEPVLPGRVAATPPTSQPYPPPYVWLDQPDLVVATVGTRTELAVASFPVWISYDGNTRAQIAGLDDVVAQVWDACLHVAAARPVTATPQTVDVAGTVVRGVVVTVDVTLGALSLCLEPVLASPVPPEPVPV